MRGDWLWGFGAASALMVLVGIDLAISVIADRGWAAISRGARKRA
jgi:hypothetical protein